MPEGLAKAVTESMADDAMDDDVAEGISTNVSGAPSSTVANAIQSQQVMDSHGQSQQVTHGSVMEEIKARSQPVMEEVMEVVMEGDESVKDATFNKSIKLPELMVKVEEAYVPLKVKAEKKRSSSGGTARVAINRFPAFGTFRSLESHV